MKRTVKMPLGKLHRGRADLARSARLLRGRGWRVMPGAACGVLGMLAVKGRQPLPAVVAVRGRELMVVAVCETHERCGTVLGMLCDGGLAGMAREGTVIELHAWDRTASGKARVEVIELRRGDFLNVG
jgi:hypothetical protein